MSSNISTKRLVLFAGAGLGGVALLGATVAFYQDTITAERGYPGVGIQITQDKDDLDAKWRANDVPELALPDDAKGPLSVDEYKNVQVLGHITTGNFTKFMAAITEWVSPDAGCGYCHVPEKDENGNVVRDEDGYPQADVNRMWDDSMYTKHVARRMIQMTMHVNENWQAHVNKTGVTCYTCHRGKNVPEYIWFNESDTKFAKGMVGNALPQNAPASAAGLASLPSNAFATYFVGDANVRVQGNTPLPTGNRSSIKQGEWTYALMMHMSTGLGVNCKYCHNSRAFGDWAQSPPTRITAWHGIRMVRNLNNEYLNPLNDVYPAYRKGPTGDAPKTNCATCHQGAYKPLLGYPWLKDWPILAKAVEQPEKKEEEPEPDPMAEGAGGGDGAGGSDGAGGAPSEEAEAPPAEAPAAEPAAPAAPKAPPAAEPKVPAAPKAPAPAAPKAP